MDREAWKTFTFVTAMVAAVAFFLVFFVPFTSPIFGMLMDKAYCAGSKIAGTEPYSHKKCAHARGKGE